MIQTSKKIRTRYAPSPTGFLHIGGARTALFCYLYAKKMDGDFIVRIEDTDTLRNIEAGEKSQLENLRWLGVIPDETTDKVNNKYAPYRQSERKEIYTKYLNKLIEDGIAYYSYDNGDEVLKQKQEQEKNGKFSFRYDRNWLKISDQEKEKRVKNKEFSIRIKVPKNKIYKWKDIVRGEIEINSDEISEFVIYKSSGIPTYNFANVIDDHLMDITHVFRGEEHISNTPKQLLLYKIFGWEPPKFGHLTIITNSEGKKLSKRDKNTTQFIEQYREDKYVPHSVFNFLTLLGWTSKDAKEIMPKEELIKKFILSRLSNSPSKFDTKKLEWIATKYFRKLSIEELRDYCLPFIKENITNKSNEWVDMLLKTFQPQMHCGKNIIKLSSVFFDNKQLTTNDNDYLKEHKTTINVFLKELNSLSFEVNDIKLAIKNTQKITNKKGKDLFMPIRMATTLESHGPDLATTIYLLGNKKIKERLLIWTN